MVLTRRDWRQSCPASEGRNYVCPGALRVRRCSLWNNGKGTGNALCFGGNWDQAVSVSLLACVLFLKESEAQVEGSMPCQTRGGPAPARPRLDWAGSTFEGSIQIGFQISCSLEASQMLPSSLPGRWGVRVRGNRVPGPMLERIMIGSVPLVSFSPPDLGLYFDLCSQWQEDEEQQIQPCASSASSLAGGDRWGLEARQEKSLWDNLLWT